MESNYGLEDWEDSQTEPWGDDEPADDSQSDADAAPQRGTQPAPDSGVDHE